ncbi:MAG: hypothetical protein ABI703_06870 [Gemmatimonadales bacterium]
MLSQPRLLFDSSVAALVLVNARNRPAPSPTARPPAPTPRLTGGRPTTLPIQFAPEPDPTTNVVDLGQEQSTGPLPLGFEFEFFGTRYTLFDLSSERDARAPLVSWLLRFPRSDFLPLNVTVERNGFIALGWTDEFLCDRTQVAYEVRGLPHRRRLVLSFTRVPPFAEEGTGTITAQLILHERTGMIDVHTRSRETVATEVKEEAVRFTTA